MYAVYCPECGNNVTFTDDEVKAMYQQFKHSRNYGLPKEIYCSYCKNMHDKESICTVVKG